MKEKKTKEILFRLDEKLRNDLDEYCLKNKVYSMSAIIRRSIRKYILLK